MKERENRESWIRANDRPSRDAYQSISLYCFVLLLQGFFGCGRIWALPEPNGPRAVFALAQAHGTGYLN